MWMVMTFEHYVWLANTEGVPIQTDALHKHWMSALHALCSANRRQHGTTTGPAEHRHKIFTVHRRFCALLVGAASVLGASQQYIASSPSVPLSAR